MAKLNRRIQPATKLNRRPMPMRIGVPATNFVEETPLYTAYSFPNFEPEKFFPNIMAKQGKLWVPIRSGWNCPLGDNFKRDKGDRYKIISGAYQYNYQILACHDNWCGKAKRCEQLWEKKGLYDAE